MGEDGSEHDMLRGRVFRLIVTLVSVAVLVAGVLAAGSRRAGEDAALTSSPQASSGVAVSVTQSTSAPEIPVGEFLPEATRSAGDAMAVANSVDGAVDLVAATATNAAAAAAALSDGDAGGDSDVEAYLLTYRGSFVGNQAKVPAGFDPPRGEYLSVGLDATGAIVGGWSISSDPPRLG